VRIGSETKTLPADLGGDVLRLSTYCEFGAPSDSIVALDARIRTNMESLVPAVQLEAFKAAVLRRPLSLAVEVIGPHPVASLGPSADPFINAVRAIDRGDLRSARVLADSLDAFRAGSAPGEITMDVVLQEAWLRATIGDTAAAARSLDRAFRGLSRAPVSLLEGSTLASALVRAMQFRSDLAAAGHDAATRDRWHAAVQELWANADGAAREGVQKLDRHM
jgi:hypothetical protein